MTPNDIIARLTRRRIVPVVRTPTAEAAETAVAWLSEAGIGVFEITMTVPGAVHVIRSLSAGNKDALIGAGTVFTAAEAEACIEAGARFIVSPATVPEVMDACRRAGIACIPGTLTPTEVRTAIAAGATSRRWPRFSPTCRSARLAVSRPRAFPTTLPPAPPSSGSAAVWSIPS